MQLLERDHELGQLRAACESARAAQGRLVVVEGPAGYGKSALLAAAKEQATDNDMRVLAARGSELERGLAFGAIAQLFEKVLARASRKERESLLAGAAAPAERAIAPAAERDAAEAGPAAGFAALHGIYWLATHLSLAMALFVVVDDLHWVDASSVRALAYLARRIGDLPITLVVALRPDEPGTPVELLDELRAEPDATRIALQPLQHESVAIIVRASIPAADDALCSACANASGGNPFYLRELLRTIQGDGQSRDPVALVQEVALPELGNRVVRRVGRIGPEAVALAHAMAVLGDERRLADAAAVASLDDDVAASAANRMKRIDVLVREDPFTFVHPLVRRSLYDTLPVTERDAMHQAAAERLRATGAEVEPVATQLAAVRPAGSGVVVDALQDAARAAMARAAPDAAIGWLRRALEEDAPEPPQAVLLRELGEIEVFARDPAAIEHLQQAHRLTTEPVTRAHVALQLAEILVNAGQWEPAVVTVSRAIDELGDRDPVLAVELEALRAATRAFDPRMVPAFDRDRGRLLELARGESWAARALSVLLGHIAGARGDPIAEAQPLVEQGLRDGRLLAERGAGSWASAQALGALSFIDADDRALEVVDELEVQVGRSGSVIGAMTVAGIRGWVHSKRGDLVAAEAVLRPPLDLAVQNQMLLFAASCFWWLQDAVFERPALEDVADLVVSIEVDPVLLATTAGAMFLEVRGRLRLARGDRAGAVDDLRAAVSTYRGLKFGPTYTRSRSALALALPPGERDEALALVEEELALAAASGLARPHGIALRAAGLLQAERDGLAPLQESVALLEGSPFRLEHARSLVELGAALRRRGRRAEAREPLAQGMDLAHRGGAERLAERAREELHAAGARPRRIARSGVEALTASELRTARLAAEGRSNPEIAQELFVSLKTVETHLSHAYAKLGLSGPGARRALEAALERR